MNKIISIFLVLLFIGAIFSQPMVLGATHKVASGNSGALVTSTLQNNASISGSQSEKFGNNYDISSKDGFIVTGTIDSHQNDKVAMGKNNPTAAVSIHLKTPSGVVVSVEKGKGVHVENGRLHFVNMTKPLRVFPSNSIRGNLSRIAFRLKTERNQYVYELHTNKSLPRGIYISANASNRVTLPPGIRKVYLNGTVFDFTNSSGNLTIPVRARIKNRDLIMRHDGRYISINDSGVIVKVKKEVAVDNGTLLVGNKTLYILPYGIKKKIVSLTNASINAVNLSDNDEMLEYNVHMKRRFKVLGLFSVDGEVTTSINAETGQVKQVNRPWWSFLSFGENGLHKGEYLK